MFVAYLRAWHLWGTLLEKRVQSPLLRQTEKSCSDLIHMVEIVANLELSLSRWHEAVESADSWADHSHVCLLLLTQRFCWWPLKIPKVKSIFFAKKKEKCSISNFIVLVRNFLRENGKFLNLRFK